MMVRCCIRLTQRALVCEAIRYSLGQVSKQTKLEKNFKKDYSGRRTVIAFLYLFLFRSLLRLSSNPFLSQTKINKLSGIALGALK